MSFVIRQASINDTAGIARVIQEALDDNPDETQIMRALQEKDHITLVAIENETIAGFASGFLTWSSSHQFWRWELDLLGVLLDFQGRGLGRQLIATCTDMGQKLIVGYPILPRIARGLVATHNIASQKAFAHAGYALQPDIMGLFISTGDYPDYVPLLPEKTDLVPVNTLTYRGFWIEGDITQAQTLHAAQVTKTRYGWYSTGAVVPLAKTLTCQLLHNNDFMFLGQYQWWEKQF